MGGGWGRAIGPLLYHWQSFGSDAAANGVDERYSQSVELTLEEVLHAVRSVGFAVEVRWGAVLGWQGRRAKLPPTRPGRSSHTSASPAATRSPQNESFHRCTYAADRMSMMQTWYDAALFCARKPE